LFDSVPPHDSIATLFVTDIADLLPQIIDEEDSKGPWTDFMNDYPIFGSTYIKVIHQKQKIGRNQLKLRCMSHPGTEWGDSMNKITRLTERKQDPFKCSECKSSYDVEVIQSGADAIRQWKQARHHTKVSHEVSRLIADFLDSPLKLIR
jgi:hypothetical protein